jgi:hypothetical protein
MVKGGNHTKPKASTVWEDAGRLEVPVISTRLPTYCDAWPSLFPLSSYASPAAPVVPAAVPVPRAAAIAVLIRTTTSSLPNSNRQAVKSMSTSARIATPTGGPARSGSPSELSL